MYGGPSDGRRVAEMIGDLRAHMRHRPTELSIGLRWVLISEGQGGQDSSRPGPEVLGREALAQDVSQIGVDVLGSDVGPCAVVIAVRQQIGVGRGSASFQRGENLDDVGLDHLEPAALAGLGGEVEDDGATLNMDVLLLEGGEPVATVLLGVGLAPGPEAAQLEQAHGTAQDAFLRHAFEVEIVVHPGTKIGQLPSEAEDSLVLLA